MSPFNCLQLNIALMALKRGENALPEIYSLIGGRMYALAIGILKNQSDAEDVVEECLIKIYTNIYSYSDNTNAYAWVMKIVRNTCFSILRKRKVRAEENIDDFFSLTDKNYDPEKMDQAIIIESAISKLTTEQKKMIYYRYYIDLTVREIAKETGMSKSAVARKITQSEQALKELLGVGKGE